MGQGINHPDLFADKAIIENVNWIPKHKFKGIYKCSAKFRYRQSDTSVELEWIEDNKLVVNMLKPVRAVTPGQQAVFYDGEVCLGGGVIEVAYFKEMKRLY